MKTKDIKFLEIRYLRGPNIWTYRPVIEAIVDIGELEDSPSNTIPGFVDRLKSFVPSLIEHRCSYGERGGFLRRLEEGTWPAHILEHISLELQNLAGMPGGFGKARGRSVRSGRVFCAGRAELAAGRSHQGFLPGGGIDRAETKAVLALGARGQFRRGRNFAFVHATGVFALRATDNHEFSFLAWR